MSWNPASEVLLRSIRAVTRLSSAVVLSALALLPVGISRASETVPVKKPGVAAVAYHPGPRLSAERVPAPPEISSVVVIYDNTLNSGSAYYAGQALAEAIDDLHAVSQGTLVRLSFEYFDPDSIGAAFDAYVSIYSNPNESDIGITLRGGPYAIENLARGRHLVSLDVPDGPEIGPHMWMGVRFTSRTAGLIINEVPTVGSSHDYYLENGNYFYFTGRPKANFSLRLEADESPVGVQLIALNDGGDPDAPDQILRVPELETGRAELAGTLGHNFIEPRTIAAFPSRSRVPSSNIGISDRVFVVDQNRLVELDRDVGTGTVLGAIGFPGVTGIAFHPSGTLYGVTQESNLLLRIDTDTGRGTPVLTNLVRGATLNDLSFHPNGNFFILSVANQVIYRIDIVSGQVVNKWDVPSEWTLRSLLWSVDGTTLYSVGTGRSANRIVALDLPTTTDVGAIDFVSREDLGFSAVESLAWLSNEGADALFDGTTSTGTTTPRRSQLYANRPNPFNPATQIDFDLSRPDDVRLTVYDVAGRRITTLFQGRLGAGLYHVTWKGSSENGKPVASGVYYYRLNGKDWAETRSMVLVR